MKTTEYFDLQIDFDKFYILRKFLSKNSPVASKNPSFLSKMCNAYGNFNNDIFDTHFWRVTWQKGSMAFTLYKFTFVACIVCKAIFIEVTSLLRL